MSTEALITLAITLFTMLVTPLVYIWRQLVNRIDVLEKQQARFIDETSMRIIMLDKIEPIQQDLKQIQTSLDRLTDHLLKLKE